MTSPRRTVGGGCLLFLPELTWDGALDVGYDLFGDLVYIPGRVFPGSILVPVAELHFVVGEGDGTSVAVAKGKVEDVGVGVVGQAEELHRLDDAHHGDGLLLLDGLGDKAHNVAAQDIIAAVRRDLHDGGGRLGDLVGLAADDDEALGGFRAHCEELGYVHAKGIGDAFQFRYGGVSFDAGEEVADRGSYAVGDVGELQALGFGQLPEVLFDVGHDYLRFWTRRYD